MQETEGDAVMGESLYQKLLEGPGMTDDELPQFEDFDKLKAKLAEIFANKTRAEWTEIFGKNLENIN